MQEPRWLGRLVVDTIHAELLQEHGGAPGIRAGGDELTESALARSRNRFASESRTCDLCDLAAAYLFGLVRNHGYVDGNKRVAFAAAATFLLFNGWRLTAHESAAFEMVMAVARGDTGEEALASWIRAHAAR